MQWSNKIKVETMYVDGRANKQLLLLDKAEEQVVQWR